MRVTARMRLLGGWSARRPWVPMAKFLPVDRHEAHTRRSGYPPSMKPLLTLSATVVLLAGCGGTPSQDSASSSAPASSSSSAAEQTTPTTTGLHPDRRPHRGHPPAGRRSPAARRARASPPLPPVRHRAGSCRSVIPPRVSSWTPSTRTVAVAKRNPYELVLINADTGDVTKRVPLPGAVAICSWRSPGGPVLVPVESANALVRVDLPGGNAEPQIITGTVPHDASEAPNGSVFVANEHGGTTTVPAGQRHRQGVHRQRAARRHGPRRQSDGDARRSQERSHRLRRRQADHRRLDPAGAGPTHLVADKHGRYIAADTRGNAVRVFSTDPREVASVPHPARPTASPTTRRATGCGWLRRRPTKWSATTWPSVTPREVARVATVQNPYTLGVDSTTGRLFIAGVTGGVVQISTHRPRLRTWVFGDG